jgi:hypothetical protein
MVKIMASISSTYNGGSASLGTEDGDTVVKIEFGRFSEFVTTDQLAIFDEKSFEAVQRGGVGLELGDQFRVVDWSRSRCEFPWLGKSLDEAESQRSHGCFREDRGHCCWMSSLKVDVDEGLNCMLKDTVAAEKFWKLWVQHQTVVVNWPFIHGMLPPEISL